MEGKKRFYKMRIHGRLRWWMARSKHATTNRRRKLLGQLLAHGGKKRGTKEGGVASRIWAGFWYLGSKLRTLFSERDDIPGGYQGGGRRTAQLQKRKELSSNERHLGI